MATGVIPVGHPRLDNDQHSSGQINGVDIQPVLPLPQNGAGNVAAETLAPSNNKIVIKSKLRPVATDAGQDQKQCPESNELAGNDVEDIQRLYETNPEAFRQWLIQKAPSDLLNRIRHHETAATTKPFASNDLFHRWIAFSPTKVS